MTPPLSAGPVVAAACLGLAALLLVPGGSSSVALSAPSEQPACSDPATRSARWRPVLAILAGVGAALFLGGRAGLVAGPVAGAVAWFVLARAEPAAVRREREQTARDLPHLVGLLAATLRAGVAPADGLRTVCAALPGAAATRLGAAVDRLRLGGDPATLWAALTGDPVLAPLGRTLARSHISGTSVVEAVERLADDLAHEALTAVEDRARQVGVKAAVPLGLCLLPAFLLIGIVPTVAGLLATLAP